MVGCGAIGWGKERVVSEWVGVGQDEQKHTVVTGTPKAVVPPMPGRMPAGVQIHPKDRVGPFCIGFQTSRELTVVAGVA